MVSEGGRQAVEQLSLGDRDSSDRLRVRALSKGLEILSLFSADRPELSLRDIVSETGFPRPSAYRLLRTLQDAHYLVLDAQTSNYRLGPAMIPALNLLRQHSNLARLLQEDLQALADVSGEQACLAVTAERTAVVIATTASSSNPFLFAFPKGRIHAGLASALSKVLAAFMDRQELAAVLATPSVACTVHTTTDPGLVAAEIARVAEEGVAFDIEEYLIGVGSVAAPIRDRSGAVVAAVAVLAAVDRFGAERRPLLADMVKTFAARMSAQLGYSSD